MHPMPLSCQRCGSQFECNAQDVSSCQCSSASLSAETILFLRKTRFDCLCKDCLSQVNELIDQTKQERFPRTTEDLKAGIHYTIENGNWVFSERYHILRGNCCGNGCRHCPYGFIIKERNEVGEICAK